MSGFVLAAILSASWYVTAQDHSWVPVVQTTVQPSTAFDGQWSGLARGSSNTPVSLCSDGSYELNVKNSEITGTVVFLDRSRGRLFQSRVTGSVAADGSAVLRLVPFNPDDREARRSRFSGTFSNTQFKATDEGRSCTYSILLERK